MEKKDIKFFALLAVGTILTLVGLFTPPIGALSESLIVIISQLTLLVAALYEVSIVLDFKNMFFCVGRYKHFFENIKKDNNEKHENEQKENTPKTE